MLRGYSMKRTKPEIVDAIQYYAGEAELYRLIDRKRADNSFMAVQVLLWVSGLGNKDDIEEKTRDLCQLKGDA
jgi:hypothetical protein